MRRGITFSSLLHLAILLLAYFGVPSLFSSEEVLERPIPVTIYTVREETVLPPPQAPEVEAEAEPEPEPEPEPDKEAVPIPPAPDVAHEAPPPQTSTMSRVSDEPLSLSVSDAIRRQVEDNWNVPAGAADAADLTVEIRISLRSDGGVIRAVIVDQSRLTDAFYRTMAESARRAVLQASPLRDLPPEKYEQWREITFTFKPPV